MTYSYTEYLIRSLQERVENPHLRLGQVLSNNLTKHRPDLALVVHGTNLDPFYTEEKSVKVVESFLIWVEQHW